VLWDPRKSRNDAAAPAAAVADEGQVVPTKALRKFVGSLSARESPVLMDLGPVVGSNLNFFGERLGCRIIVEDLFADFDRYPKDSETPFAKYLSGRLTHAPASVDGILCWNFFDYLDAASATALAAALMRVLRPDGAVLAFFATVAVPNSRFWKHVIMDEDSLRQRPYASGGKRQNALPNRDVLRMFDGLKVAESFLLKQKRSRVPV
jgi:hypothetical protein